MKKSILFSFSIIAVAGILFFACSKKVDGRTDNIAA